MIKYLYDCFYPEQKPDGDYYSEDPRRSSSYFGFGPWFVSLDTREWGILASVAGTVVSLYWIAKSRGKQGMSSLAGCTASLIYSYNSSKNGFSIIRVCSEGAAGALAYKTAEVATKYTPSVFPNGSALNPLVQGCVAGISNKVAIDILHFRKPDATELAAVGAGSLVGGMCEMLSKFSTVPSAITDYINYQSSHDRYAWVGGVRFHTNNWPSWLRFSRALWNGAASYFQNVTIYYVRSRCGQQPENPKFNYYRNEDRAADENLFYIGTVVNPIIAMAVTGCELAFIVPEGHQAMDNFFDSHEAIPDPYCWRGPNHYVPDHVRANIRSECEAAYEGAKNAVLSTYMSKSSEIFRQANNSRVFQLPAASQDEMRKMEHEKKAW